MFEQTEEQIWQDKPISITEGRVVQYSGRPIALRYLVSRFWGWPKSAAVLASRVLREDSEGAPVELFLSGVHADAQQSEVIRKDSRILPALCRGLRGGASTESRTNPEIIDSIQLAFVRAGDRGGVTDDGLTRGLLRSLANRFGVSTDALRKATTFGQETTDILISVDVTELEEHP